MSDECPKCAETREWAGEQIIQAYAERNAQTREVERLEAEVEQARRDGIAWAVERLREFAPKGTVLRIELATVADRLWQEANGE